MKTPAEYLLCGRDFKGLVLTPFFVSWTVRRKDSWPPAGAHNLFQPGQLSSSGVQV